MHAEALQHVMTDLTAVTLQQVKDFFDQYSGTPNFDQLLLQVFPQLVQPHTQAAALISAQWYDELAPESTFKATPSVLQPAEQLTKTVKWALYAPGAAKPEERLAGASKRLVFNASTTTVIDNARQEGVRWARYASATACEFCRLLATRGAVYASKQTALKSHNHCRCIAVPERSGETYSPPAYVKAWEDEYAAASSAVSDAGKPQSFKNILAAMRQQ